MIILTLLFQHTLSLFCFVNIHVNTSVTCIKFCKLICHLGQVGCCFQMTYRYVFFSRYNSFQYINNIIIGNNNKTSERRHCKGNQSLNIPK